MNVESAQQNQPFFYQKAQILKNNRLWPRRVLKVQQLHHGTQLIGGTMLKVLHYVCCLIVAKLIQTTQQQWITWTKCSRTIRICLAILLLLEIFILSFVAWPQSIWQLTGWMAPVVKLPRTMATMAPAPAPPPATWTTLKTTLVPKVSLLTV